MTWRLSVLVGLAWTLSITAQAGEIELAPGVKARIIPIEAAELVTIQVGGDAAAEIRIVSPQTKAYDPPTRDNCEIVADAMVDRTEGRLLADMFLQICKERALLQQEPLHQDGLFLIDLVKRFEPLAILSAGYLQSFSPPQAFGYVKVDGEELSPLVENPLLSGLFCTDGVRWTIEDISAIEDVGRYPDCVQAGPFLVRERVVMHESLREFAKDTFDLEQLFLCTLVDGGILFGYADSAEVGRLAEIMLEELGCENALLLTEHLSAGLWLDGNLHGNSDIPLTNAIAIFASN